MTGRPTQTLSAAIEILEPLVLMSASTLEGTESADWISGTAVDDVISGLAGNDEIHAPQGHNQIDGGAGTDTLVIYEGVRADYVVEFRPDGRLRVSGPGLNGEPVVNDLQNVERIQFNDELVLTSDWNPAPATTAADDESPTVPHSPATPDLDTLSDRPDDVDSDLDDDPSGSDRSASRSSSGRSDVSDPSDKTDDSRSDKSTTSGKSKSRQSAGDDSQKSASSHKSTGSHKSAASGKSTASGKSAASGKSVDSHPTAASDGSAKSPDSTKSRKSAGSAVAATESVPAVSTVHPIPPDTRPIARTDAFTVAAGEPLLGNVLRNDAAGDADRLMAQLVTQPDNGSVVLSEDGELSYLPRQGFAGLDVFQYELVDERGGVSRAQVTIDVTETGPQPQEVATTLSVERPPATPPPAAPPPAAEPELPPLPQPPALILDPAPPEVLETHSLPVEPPAEALLTASPLMVDGPDADADILATAAGAELTWNVLHNDSDRNGDLLFVSDHTSAQQGTVSVAADGTLTYTADVGFTGIDFLFYDVSDGEQTDRAAVIVYVNPAGERPAGDDTLVPAEMVVSPIVFDLNEDGRIGVTGPTTARDKSGVSEIGRTVSFDLDADGTAEQIEWIDGQGDAFLVDTSQIQGTDIDGRALFGDEGGRYENGFEKLREFDRDGNGLIEVQEFARLKLWVDDGDGVLRPNELQTLQRNGIFAIDTSMQLTPDGLMQSVAFLGNDAEMLIEDVWFAEDVTATGANEPDNPADANQPPDANPDVISVAANSDVVAQVLDNDRDVDGGTLRVVSHTRAIHGEAVVTDDGQLRYSPDPGFVGNDYVQYTVSDGQGGTDTAIAVIRVRPAGTGPASSGGGEISGTIWRDANANGLREQSETDRGADVFVSLVDETGVVAQSVNTDVDGRYEFAELETGVYRIQVDVGTLPDAVDGPARLTFQDVNSNLRDPMDSDVGPTGLSSQIRLPADRPGVVTVDAGYYFA